MTFSVPPWLGLAKKQFSVFMSVCCCRDAGEDSTQNSGVAKKSRENIKLGRSGRIVRCKIAGVIRAMKMRDE